MIKPILLQDSLESKKVGRIFVFVHPSLSGRSPVGWVYSTFNANGKWASTVGDGTSSKEQVLADAEKHRRYLRRLHAKNVAKWCKKRLKRAQLDGKTL